VNQYQHWVQTLAAQGLTVERGLLVGASPDASVAGFRFETDFQQFDVYFEAAFYDADKAHPKMGQPTTVEPTDGTPAYRITRISA
jgi:hypothetical protein